MKYSDFNFPPRLLRLKQAEYYVGGQQNLKTLRRAGWVKPLIQHKGNTSFDIKTLDLAVDKANLNGWPKPIKEHGN